MLFVGSSLFTSCDNQSSMKQKPMEVWKTEWIVKKSETTSVADSFTNHAQYLYLHYN